MAVVDGFWVWAYAHCTHRMVIWLNGGGMHLPALPIRTEGVFKVRLAGESARVLYSQSVDEWRLSVYVDSITL